MQSCDSGVSEIISTVNVVLLVIALAAIIGAIIPGWAIPVQKIPYILNQRNTGQHHERPRRPGIHVAA